MILDLLIILLAFFIGIATCLGIVATKGNHHLAIFTYLSIISLGVTFVLIT